MAVHNDKLVVCQRGRDINFGISTTRVDALNHMRCLLRLKGLKIVPSDVVWYVGTFLFNDRYKKI